MDTSASDMLSALNEFYKNYIVTTADGTFQVFQSFTFGEMVIALLLLLLCVMYALKWVWESLR